MFADIQTEALIFVFRQNNLSLIIFQVCRHRTPGSAAAVQTLLQLVLLLPAHTVVLHTQLQYRCRRRVSGGRAVAVSTRVTWMNNHSCMNDWTTLIEQPSTIAIEIDVYYRDNIVEGKQFNLHLRGLLANTNYINLTFGIKILNSKSILNQS